MRRERSFLFSDGCLIPPRVPGNRIPTVYASPGCAILAAALLDLSARHAVDAVLWPASRHAASMPRLQQPLTIRTEVPLVVLPVTVTDSRGKSIDGLTVADFVVLDNGKPRQAQVDARMP